MSVLMTLHFDGDKAALQRAVEENRDEFLGIAERAKQHGAIHHKFYAGQGEIVAVDEWETPEAFQAFFDAEGDRIGKVMGAAGISGPSGPPTFHETLDLGDAF